MWINYNPNPNKNNVGDCSVRALTKATGRSWDDVYSELCSIGFKMADMPSANHVWGAYLRKYGFKRKIVDDHNQDIYTVADFCRDNPRGTYVLAIPGHVVCVRDGDWFDSWDSSRDIPVYYWER